LTSRRVLLNTFTTSLICAAKYIYSKGGQTTTREPLHAALSAFRKIMYLFFISFAKCRNIVKCYCTYYSSR